MFDLLRVIIGSPTIATESSRRTRRTRREFISDIEHDEHCRVRSIIRRSSEQAPASSMRCIGLRSWKIANR